MNSIKFNVVNIKMFQVALNDLIIFQDMLKLNHSQAIIENLEETLIESLYYEILMVEEIINKFKISAI